MAILCKMLQILSFFDQKYLKTEKLKSGVRIALALLFTEINDFIDLPSTKKFLFKKSDPLLGLNALDN